MPAYADAELWFRRLADLDGARSMLSWDAATLMPPGGAEPRAGQIATLEAISHAMLTDPPLAELLEEATGEDGLDDWQQANLREMQHRWRHANAQPTALVERRSMAASRCELVWRRARQSADFAMVRPHLEEVVSLTREIARAKGAALGCDPYDALLDRYEPGLRGSVLDRIFGDIEAFLPGFLERVLERQKGEREVAEPEGPFPLEAQRALSKKIMEILGFDFRYGRLDISAHPFAGGVPGDVRVTTRYSQGEFVQGLMAVLHETGHALYELGLPEAWRNQPVGRARSPTVHESQSLLIETQACRTRVFVAFLAPLLRQYFRREGPAWEAGNLYRLVSRVRPGMIRVEADEVTYHLHVLMRYRLEKALIAGDLSVADLPAAWNEEMQKRLGLAPRHDGEGCLQDIHWYYGTFGYFPSYSLGAVLAAQLFDSASRASPGLMSSIGRGSFAPLLNWLRSQVHQKGSLLGTDDLIAQATGKPLGTEAFKAHLRNRYLP
ncbi:MAG: carboxypeptidase M32 [Acetobacterales bacterium]